MSTGDVVLSSCNSTLQSPLTSDLIDVARNLVLSQLRTARPILLVDLSALQLDSHTFSASSANCLFKLVRERLLRDAGWLQC